MKTALFICGRAINLARSRLPVMTRLQREGWRVVGAASPRPSLSHVEAVKSAGISYRPVHIHRYGFSPRHDLRSLCDLADVLRESEPDLVHAFNPKPILLGGLLAPFSKNDAPWVATVTGMGAKIERSLRTLLVAGAYRAVLGRYEAVTFENEPVRRMFTDRLGLGTRTYRYISSGVKISRFQADPDQGQRDPNPLRVLFASRLLWSKGIRTFVEAARKLNCASAGGRRTMPEVEFVVAGELDEQHQDGVPESYVAKQDDRGVIEYLGHVPIDQMPPVILGSDIIVLPSHREGAPKLLMEAAAAAKPVVASKIPGITRIVDHNSTGLLVPVRDAASLADAIRRLATDVNLRRRLGQRAFDKAVDEFATETVVMNTLRVYRDVLEGVGLKRNNR